MHIVNLNTSTDEKKHIQMQTETPTTFPFLSAIISCNIQKYEFISMQKSTFENRNIQIQHLHRSDGVWCELIYVLMCTNKWNNFEIEVKMIVTPRVCVCAKFGLFFVCSGIVCVDTIITRMNECSKSLNFSNHIQ